MSAIFLSDVDNLSKGNKFLDILNGVEDLSKLVEFLGLRHPVSNVDLDLKHYFVDILIYEYKSKWNGQQVIDNIDILPTEVKIIIYFQSYFLKQENEDDDLTLPILTLQYLNQWDLIYRNLILYQK